MMRAVKAVTTYRGRDPRDFALFAFGGNGGIHAVDLARALQDRREVIVPAAAGVFSAHRPAVRRARASTRPRPSCGSRRGAARRTRSARASLRSSTAIAARLGGDPALQSASAPQADLRFVGQAFELTVPFAATARPSTRDCCARLRDAFDRRARRALRPRLRRASSPSRSSTCALVGTRRPAAARRSICADAAGETAPSRGARRPISAPSHGTLDTPVIGRAGLDRAPRHGPAGDRGVRGHVGRAARLHRAALDASGNIIDRRCRDGGAARSEAHAQRVDPFQLEVIKSSFDAIADDMALTLMRTAHSGDRARLAGFLDRDLRRRRPDAGAGDLHADAARQLLRRHGAADPPLRGRIAPGDVFIANDPYAAAASTCPTSTSSSRSSRASASPRGRRRSRTTPTSAASSPAATRSAPTRSTRRGCVCRSSSSSRPASPTRRCGT